MNTATVTLRLYLKEGKTLKDVIVDWNYKFEHEDLEFVEIISCRDENKAKVLDEYADIDVDDTWERIVGD